MLTVFGYGQNRAVNSPSFVVTTGVNLCLGAFRMARVVAQSGYAGGPGHTSLANPGRLDGKSLSHDGASLAKQLQLGEGAAARRRSLRASRGRQGAEGSRGRLLEEGTHGLGLTKDGVHGQIRGN